MEIRRVRDDELDEVAGWLAAQQADPARHIAYLAVEPDAIAQGLQELDPGGLEDVLVAVVGGDVVGLLAAEHDLDPPRVWWHGPFVADGHDALSVAEALLAAGRERLPGRVTEEEFGPDDRHGWMGVLAGRHGFRAEEASAVLGRSLTDGRGELRARADVPRTTDLAPLTPGTAPAVAALHDRVFPGTHASGARIATPGDGRVVLVATRAGEVVGYVAVERQEDGSGYIDYLGVSPEVRRGGIGRALVAAGCLALADELGCPSADLTVRESNRGARRLYETLGFQEERLIRPWRRGFSLAHLDAAPR